MIEFLAGLFFRRSFWYLFLATATIVIMAGWRQKLRDDIFQEAARTTGRFTYY